MDHAEQHRHRADDDDQREPEPAERVERHIGPPRSAAPPVLP
jgi:hypothetical protein